MGLRREARERAVQFLFQYDLNPGDEPDLAQQLNLFWDTHRLSESGYEKGKATWGKKVELPAPTTRDASVRVFAEDLIRGVLEKKDDLDLKLQKYLRNWDMARMAVVDRNVLRMAIYELYYREDIPPIVSLNEAIEIAKRFSTRESGKFVNGLLDRIRQDILRPARTPLKSDNPS
ncbi:MAG: transcription antitermination factor NusB [Verrucomicrobia bacterium]|jgi:transcription antitermination protein NusB|nr:transcription antitermination factor NusB [Verrucomicrobiota bacterium]